jgi:hypothetical protein
MGKTNKVDVAQMLHWTKSLIEDTIIVLPILEAELKKL